jgi:tetratricopeptide (TPR) repeat protein
MLKKNLYLTFLILIAILSLALKPEELGQPWAEVARLKESREYNAAIKILEDYAKSASSVETISEIYYQIGSIYHEYIHDYNQALVAYQRVMDLSKKAKSILELEPYLGLSRMSIADIYRRIGQYDDAIKMYKEVANDYPGTGYVSVAMKDINGIQDALIGISKHSQIIDSHPKTEFAAESQFEIAELYLSSQGLNNPLRAIQEYNRLIEQYSFSPRAAEAQLKIGNIYRNLLHDPVKAISTYQKLLNGPLASSKISSEALFRIGRIYYSDLREYEKALEIFDKILREYPSYWKFPAIVYWKGMCHEHKMDYENAIEAYEMFIQIYPDEELSLLADIGRLGERNVKARMVSKIQELKKTAPEYLWNEAEQFRSKGKYRESLTIYYNLMSKYPDSDYSKKAKTQSDKVRKFAEIQICSDIVKNGGIEAAASNYRIAEIYETELLDFNNAINEYEKVAANYPETSWAVNALYRLGLMYSGVNTTNYNVNKKSVKPRYNKAIEKYRQLINRYPNTYASAEAYYQIGEIYRIHLANYSQALESYEKVLNNYPIQTLYVGEGYKDSIADEAQFKIGRIYYENLKDYDLALKAFSKFLKEYPDSCRKAAAYSFIAFIYEKQKSRKAAVDSLEQIIVIVDNSDIQASFFARDALFVNSSAGSNIGDDNIQNIIKGIRQRITQIQGQN